MNKEEDESQPLLCQVKPIITTNPDNPEHDLENGNTIAFKNDEDKKSSSGKKIEISLEKRIPEYESCISEKPYDPFANRDLDHPTTNCDTMIHLIKGNIGTGILAMPDAFRNAGLIVGSIGTVFIGAICVYTMHLLVKCSHELCRRTRVPSLGFADVAEAAFTVGPTALRKYSHVARITVNVLLFVVLLGICCVYFVFVASNLKEMVDTHLDYELSVQTYLAMALIPMIVLNWIQSLKFLVPFSMIANVFMGVGLIIIFIYIFEDLPSINREGINIVFSSMDQIPLYFGTAVYAFEGIGVVLPLEKDMKSPQDFGGIKGVLSQSMIIMMILYITVGFFGYLKYGDAIQGSITLNLPLGAPLAESVRLMMILAIFLSYALQFYVLMDIAWPSIKAKIPTKRMQLVLEYVFRTLLVIITFAFAALIPDLKLVISLVGAMSMSMLALVFPTVINILVNYSTGYGKYRWMLLKDIALILFGFLGCVTGTYASIVQIFQGQSHH